MLRFRIKRGFASQIDFEFVFNLVVMSHEKVYKSIKRFIKKKGRVGFELRELNELFRVGHQIHNFYNILGKQQSLQAAFKILLLIHRLIIERSQA